MKGEGVELRGRIKTTSEKEEGLVQQEPIPLLLKTC